MNFRAARLPMVIALALVSLGAMIRARAVGRVPGWARRRAPTVLAVGSGLPSH